MKKTALRLVSLLTPLFVTATAFAQDAAGGADNSALAYAAGASIGIAAFGGALALQHLAHRNAGRPGDHFGNLFGADLRAQQPLPRRRQRRDHALQGRHLRLRGRELRRQHHATASAARRTSENDHAGRIPTSTRTPREPEVLGQPTSP